MIVDDRLETVLRTNVAGKTAGRTQLRQLVDLLGTVPLAKWNARHAAALQRVDSLASQLSDEECAAVLRGVPHRSAVLVYHFAQKTPRTASAAVASARLTDEDWLALIPRLPTTARGFVRHRSDLGAPVRKLLSQLGVDDFLLPEPAGIQIKPAQVAVTDAPPAPPPPPTPDAPLPELHPDVADGIGAIVRRIEAFRAKRKERDAATGEAPGQPRTDGVAPRFPFAEEADAARPAPLSIDLRTDALGTVVHAAIDPPGMLVGSTVFCADPAAPVHCNKAMALAFRHHQPISAGQLQIDGAPMIAGAWQADGTPLFAPDRGRFTGYLLRLRRPLVLAPVATPAQPAPPASDEADRLRQLLHELRTPINAIQGFAEMIQSQALGSTPHHYRAMAASIAADAAQILAGFEEVERLVKLESRALTLDPGEADAAEVVTRLIDQVTPVFSARNVRLAVNVPDAALPVGMAADELERSVWRVLSVIAASVAPGERLTIALETGDRTAHLSIALPAALYRLGDAALFAPDVAGNSGSFSAPAMLGNGFALRLARAEFEAANGTLLREGERLMITLPRADNPAPASTAQG
ncbi:MAG: sensor histidine kinase [Novosphingobium sp.]|uniref:sensor histidine kinase n=1 Tax=Novosphingobium sp. TaxID=1874826 RepID=UPI003B9B00F9